MRILIAPDKFKGCLSADAVAAAIATGAREVDSSIEIDICPLADGGEGTVAALVAATGGKTVTRRVTGPLPEMKVDATFGILGSTTLTTGGPTTLATGGSTKLGAGASTGLATDGDGKTAVVEMSAASG